MLGLRIGIQCRQDKTRAFEELRLDDESDESEKEEAGVSRR